ncbi:hypothetical protein D1872_255320 [compost metagenome]
MEHVNAGGFILHVESLSAKHARFGGNHALDGNLRSVRFLADLRNGRQLRHRRLVVRQRLRAHIGDRDGLRQRIVASLFQAQIGASRLARL